ncbi:hypothetical protein [Pollutibacter soli]|uniref:hypothetical protein n=1 Tax=Pollutibacter soli TaxID=3034157 RepID=UPI003013E820
MDQNKILWNLMAKKLAGESTETELSELNRILQSNPDAEYYLRVLEKWWLMTETQGPASGKAFEQFMEKMESVRNQHKPAPKGLLPGRNLYKGKMADSLKGFRIAGGFILLMLVLAIVGFLTLKSEAGEFTRSKDAQKEMIDNKPAARLMPVTAAGILFPL